MPNHIKQPTKQQDTPKSVRTSVSLPPELHDTLERIAKGKKVSVAWVIRDAADKYVNEQWPLLQQEQPLTAK
jgi:metal-responsive CopG/Arc/MetJ family transcriptional regulator